MVYSYIMLRKNYKLLMCGILLINLTWVFSACGSGKPAPRGEQGSTGSPEEDTGLRKPGKISFLEPSSGARFHSGEQVMIRLEADDRNPQTDSIVLRIDGERISQADPASSRWTWTTAGEKLGTRRILAQGYSNGELVRQGEVRVVLLADRPPVQYGYRVVKTYPHDPEAYTQGLIYEDGYLYESTGQYGYSSLRKVKLEDGEVLNMLKLSDDLFAEGICLFNDRIIQLTWTSRVGFVYDRESFRLLNKVHYPTQGWGLTTNGTELIMSDGTQLIYFLEPDYFTEMHRIEVYDDRDPVMDLNELEYIRGEIWANVYQTDRIVRIDPQTGRVTGVIDLTGLLQQKYRNSRTDVLNGIAWDEQNERLFVTGKMWPLLFEIELIKK